MQGIGCLISQQFKQGDPSKQVHALWYIIASPIWQALDENYLRQFARRAHETGCPILVLINKAGLISCSMGGPSTAPALTPPAGAGLSLHRRTP